MAELKIYLPDDLSKKFRRIAMSVYGYGRGSISKAAEEALMGWCSNREQPAAMTNSISPGESTTNESEKTDSGINPDERIRAPADGKKPVGSNNSS